MDIILHHYDQSPYSEKIRLIFGLKNLSWKSVIVPMVLPKPSLMPLAGGYRRTPILQIGADVYCDTLQIASELDRRFPEPRVTEASCHGLSSILSTWAERVLMWPTARYVTGANRDVLPTSFFADRAAMRGHSAPTADEIDAGLCHQRHQLCLMLDWIENLLADGREFLITDRPVLGDLAAYQRLWWLGALGGKAADVLDPYAHIKAWMGRIAAAGHGQRTEMTPEAALEIARTAEPAPLPSGECDPSVEIGAEVEVVTEDFGTDPVRGSVIRATAEQISIRRSDAIVGAVHVHFPRLGYEVKAI
ncbi:MAG: glutathione S-transferase family protein [Alphaproteobacteria bacterium]|nr:glutathione S-transferase family protein [Alphaproteobacteria bacterium]